MARPKCEIYAKAAGQERAGGGMVPESVLGALLFGTLQHTIPILIYIIVMPLLETLDSTTLFSVS